MTIISEFCETKEAVEVKQELIKHTEFIVTVPEFPFGTHESFFKTQIVVSFLQSCNFLRRIHS